MLIGRRGFLGGLLATLAAPAIVKAASLEYVPRGLILPKHPDFVQTLPPTITGSLDVGGTLTATEGEWTSAPELTRTWLRNGIPLDPQPGDTYTLTEADREARFVILHTHVGENYLAPVPSDFREHRRPDWQSPYPRGRRA